MSEMNSNRSKFIHSNIEKTKKTIRNLVRKELCQNVYQVSCRATTTAESLDWETWKHDIPFWKHAIAGSCAGITEHTVVFPIDTLKTHLQATFLKNTELTVNQNIKTIYRSIYRNLGFRGFFRGLATINIGCVPAHASLFSMYELSKKHFGTDTVFRAGISGGLATMSHDVILTPIDVIKQRLQLGYYVGAFDCIQKIIKYEGVMSFYRSIYITIFMNIPYGAVFVATNEKLKKYFSPTLLQHFLTAGFSGSVAGFITTPMDVVKTRLQIQNLDFLKNQDKGITEFFEFKQYLRSIHSEPSFQPKLRIQHQPLKYKNFYSAFKTILVEEGFFGLWKGALPRTILNAPSAAVCWGVYESVKYFLTESITITP